MTTHRPTAVVHVDGRSINVPFPPKAVLDLGFLIVVMFDPDANIPRFGQFRNLVGFSRTGEIVWTADLPTSTTGDCYLAVEIGLGDSLRARSFSCFDVEVDARNGLIRNKEFTK